MTRIETARLTVRGFRAADAADLHAILGDAAAMEYGEPAYDLGKTERFLTSFCMGQNGALAAVHRESGRVIGYILFKALDEGVYEMGWIFNRGFWRQGYACEACRAVIDDAFTRRKAHKIVAETIDGVKSVGLMRKLGMRPEGVQRAQTRDIHGDWADMYLYGLLKEEWERER